MPLTTNLVLWPPTPGTTRYMAPELPLTRKPPPEEVSNSMLSLPVTTPLSIWMPFRSGFDIISILVSVNRLCCTHRSLLWCLLLGGESAQVTIFAHIEGWLATSRRLQPPGLLTRSCSLPFLMNRAVGTTMSSMSPLKTWRLAPQASIQEAPSNHARL